MKCSTTAPMQAWRNQAPPKFAILSGRQLPWKNGVLYWHLANFSDDLPKYQQVGIFKDVFSVYHHELWPLRFESTEDINLADHKIFFVDNNDKIKGTDQDSPFAFKQAPEVLAVQYIYYPGFEWSMCMFVSDRHFYSTKQVEGGLELRKIILHEGLHALGLDHSDVKGDIMEAVYDPLNDFTDDSRQGLNKIHGAARRDQVEADPAAAFIIGPDLKKCSIFDRLRKFMRL